MAREKADWSGLVQSIRANRAGKATFYKPVCVIAAIDLANIGRLDPDLLHWELIIRRFGEYVAVAFPERASAGLLPLWFLANDGLWTFSRRGKRLTREALKVPPSSTNKAREKLDTQSIAPEYRNLWESAEQRKALRNQMLLILARDAESRTLVRALFDPAAVNDPERWPKEAEIDDYLQEISDQRDLFRGRPADDNRSGGAAAARAARKALLAFELKDLPQASAVGPTFESSGDAPIRLTANPVHDVSQAQTDLHRALAAKCQNLESLASSSNNRAAHILPALVALTSALQSDPTQSSSYLIWSHANTLRRLYDAEVRALEVEDPESPPLPDRLRVLLGDLVEQFNAYALTDHIIGLLDRAKPGPAKRSESLQVLDAGVALVKAIRETPGILEPDAAKVLETATIAAQEAKQTSGFNADQAVVNAVEMQRNGARAILLNALLEVRKVFSKIKTPGKHVAEGAAKQLGAETIKQLPISKFVSDAREFFTALWHGTAGSDTVQQLVVHIRDLINQLRG